jgi:hypothetical protein
MADGLSDLYQDLLSGSYDCVDRIVLNGYFGWGIVLAVSVVVARAGPGCLNSISASISGASAGVRLPSGAGAG